MAKRNSSQTALTPKELNAERFLAQIRTQLAEHPVVFNQFIATISEYKARSVDIETVIRRVIQLFQDRKNLIFELNRFLPQGYEIELRDDLSYDRIVLRF